jgi:hypothetical protein
VFTDSPVEDELEAVQIVGLALSRYPLALFPLCEDPPRLVNHSLVSGCRFDSQTLRKEVIPAVSRPHSDDLTALPKVIDILSE